MTIVPLFLLTLGAINWGYAYPLVFLFVALLRQRMLGREIYFNFLYAPGFWLLLSAGMTYALIGMRTISGVLCLLRTIFLETTYASCSGSTPASISNFVFLRIFGAFKASPSLSPTLPMKR